MKQKTLFKLSEYNSEFGGSLLKGQRKSRRPLSGKHCLKVVLRADITKSGHLLKSRHHFENAFAQFSQKFAVKIYEVALVSNHIHFVARFSHRQNYVKFIRAITGTLAKRLKIKWLLRPWSRILAWGRALEIAINYTIQNHLEAIGEIPYQKRKLRSKPHRILQI